MKIIFSGHTVGLSLYSPDDTVYMIIWIVHVSRFVIAVSSIGEQMHRWRNHSQHVAFYHIKQIDSFAVGLFSNRSQKTSWFGRNISDCTSCATFWSHLWSLFTTWKVYLDPKLSLVPSWLDSSVGRALYRYRRGHGFKSRTGLNFFKVSFQLLVQ